jgi:hypothetical protein
MIKAFGPKGSKGFRDNYLAPVMILAALFFSVFAQAQSVVDTTKIRQQNNAFGFDFNNVKVKQALIIPNDTPKLKVSDTPAVAALNGKQYLWTGYQWLASSGASSVTTKNPITKVGDSVALNIDTNSLTAASGALALRDTVNTARLLDKGGAVYNVTAYGIYPNGVDYTTQLNALLILVNNAGGGTIQFNGGKYRFNGQIKISSSLGGETPYLRQSPITIIGAGCQKYSYLSTYPADSSGTTLDLRYNGPAGKILTMGLGHLKMTGLTLFSGAITYTPFLYDNYTTLSIEDVAFIGSQYGASASEDAIVLGGKDTTTGNPPSGGDLVNDTASHFAGYGTVINRCYFQKIRRGVYGRKYCNNVVFSNNTFWQTCGGNAAVEFYSPVNYNGSVGNTIENNLFEMTGYTYGIKMGNLANGTQIINNSFYDGTANSPTLAGVYIDSNSTNNHITYGAYDGNLPAYLTGNGSDDQLTRNNTIIVSESNQTSYFNGSVKPSGDVILRNQKATKYQNQVGASKAEYSISHLYPGELWYSYKNPANTSLDIMNIKSEFGARTSLNGLLSEFRITGANLNLRSGTNNVGYLFQRNAANSADQLLLLLNNLDQFEIRTANGLVFDTPDTAKIFTKGFPLIIGNTSTPSNGLHVYGGSDDIFFLKNTTNPSRWKHTLGPRYYSIGTNSNKIFNLDYQAPDGALRVDNFGDVLINRTAYNDNNGILLHPEGRGFFKTELVVGNLNWGDNTHLFQVQPKARFMDTAWLDQRFTYRTNIHNTFTDYSLVDRWWVDSIADQKIASALTAATLQFSAQFTGSGAPYDPITIDTFVNIASKNAITLANARIDSVAALPRGGGAGGGIMDSIKSNSVIGDSLLVRKNDSVYIQKKFKPGINTYWVVTDSTVQVNDTATATGVSPVNTDGFTFTTANTRSVLADNIIEFILVKPVSDLTSFKVGTAALDNAFVDPIDCTGGQWTVIQVNAYIDATTTLYFAGITSSTAIKIVKKRIYE